jgi:hypothetical protein
MRRSREATQDSVYEGSNTYRNQSECRIPCTNELSMCDILFFYHTNEITLTIDEKLIIVKEFSNYINFRAIPRTSPSLPNKPAHTQNKVEIAHCSVVEKLQRAIKSCKLKLALLIDFLILIL